MSQCLAAIRGNIENMTKDEDINKLRKEEARIKSLWKEIIGHLKIDSNKIDFGYIWTDELKKDFDQLESEAKKLVLILVKLLKLYEGRSAAGRKNIKKVIKAIRRLLYYLKNAEPNSKWIGEIFGDINILIEESENAKIDNALLLILRSLVGIQSIEEAYFVHGGIRPPPIPYSILIRAFYEGKAKAEDIIPALRAFLEKELKTYQRDDEYEKAVRGDINRLLKLNDIELAKALNRIAPKIGELFSNQ